MDGKLKKNADYNVINLSKATQVPPAFFSANLERTGLSSSVTQAKNYSKDKNALLNPNSGIHFFSLIA